MAFNPKLRVDITSIFNRVYASKPYEVRRVLRDLTHRDAFKNDFGSLVIDTIIERTLKGLDKNGSPFPSYSPSYKDSLAFQIYKEGNRVNLKLTGEMLASMETKAVMNGVTIQFVDSLNRAKAHGHITGMSGRKGGKVRDFFGVSKAEEDDIMKRVMSYHQTGDAAELGGFLQLYGTIGSQELQVDQRISELFL